jgi:hypothetical protein
MSQYFATQAVKGILGSAVAVTFELLPERVDLFAFVLQGAGGGGLLATSFAVVRRAKQHKRARWIEVGNACGAAFALVAFVVIALIQEVS